jgi:serine/threonine protein kinase
LSERKFASQKSRLRFVREVELTARLVHPNIARLYDSGLYRGVYYYAMELVDGVHLDQYIKSQNLSQRQILELMWIICQAVHHAHKRGVIHRDIKPSNILVSQDGQPHVLDFGLAKTFLKESSNISVSIEGDVAGTPAYMSPEQAMGRKERIDTRTDVYSIGIILYNFLTGQSPHDLSGTRFEVVRRIVENDVRSPRELNKDIDYDLDSLLLKALARDPDDRYLSAGEMADDIDNYLNGKPLMARAPSMIYFLRKKINKYRREILDAVAVLVVFAGIALFAYTRGVESGTKINVAKKEFEIPRNTNEVLKIENQLVRNEPETIDTNAFAAALEPQPPDTNIMVTDILPKPAQSEHLPAEGLPERAQNDENIEQISPGNDAVVSPATVDLAWTGGFRGASYDIYFGDSSSAVNDATHESFEFKQNQTDKGFTVNNLVSNKTYCWRVDMIRPDGNIVRGTVWQIRTEPKVYSSKLAVVNGSFESPTIADVISKGTPGLLWAGSVQFSGWVGKGSLSTTMAVEGKQCFYWNDPQDESIEQTLGYLGDESDKNYTIEYTRQIIAQPSIATLKFRAELLVGGKVVDYEEINNKSVEKGIHRLRYKGDSRNDGQPLTIRFSADSGKKEANSSESQRLYIDDVKCIIKRKLK